MFIKLTNCTVFKGLTPEKLERLFANLNYQIKSYSKEQVIASRQEACNNLLILIAGNVRGEMLDYSGKVLKVEDIYAPSPIASAFLFGQQNLFPVDVIANTEVQALSILRASVLQLFQQSEQVLHNYLNAISNRAQFLSQRIWFLSFKTIKGKLAQYILNLAKPDKHQIVMPLTQKELAEFFGVTRPSLARALGELERNKIIEVNRKEIIIKNRNQLINIIE